MMYPRTRCNHCNEFKPSYQVVKGTCISCVPKVDGFKMAKGNYCKNGICNLNMFDFCRCNDKD